MPVIGYTQNVPNPPNEPSVDVGPMQQNTNAIPTWLDVNHYQFASSEAGKHRYLQFPANTMPVSTAVGEIALGNAQTGAGSKRDIYFMPPNSSTLIQLTNNLTPVSSGTGVSWLPGGLLIQWGSITGAPIANGASASFSTPFPNNLFSLTISGVTASTADKTINISTTSLSGFTVITSGSSNFTKLYYMAIGN